MTCWFKSSSTWTPRGFRSESFHVDAARAVEARLKEGIGLPDALCQLFERWLSEPWTIHDYAVRGEQQGGDKRLMSVLWQRGGLYPLPYGAYYLLHALTYGYLLRKPPATESWLAALEAHFQAPGANSDTGSPFVGISLTCTSATTRGRVGFLIASLNGSPGYSNGRKGGCFLTNVWSFVPADLVSAWLGRVRRGQWTKGAGVWRAYRPTCITLPGRSKYAEGTESALTGDSPDLGAVRTGIAFACANMWDHANAEGRGDSVSGAACHLQGRGCRGCRNAGLRFRFTASGQRHPPPA